MQKKLKSLYQCVSYALVLSVGVLCNAHAVDQDNDQQNITLTVPLVALIDVEDISPQFTFPAPTNAGEELGTPTSTNNTSDLAISSNNSAAKFEAILQNSIDGVSLLVTATGCGTGSGIPNVLSTTTARTLCAPGELKTTSSEITILAFANSGGMIPYGDLTTTIVYTLTEN